MPKPKDSIIAPAALVTVQRLLDADGNVLIEKKGVSGVIDHLRRVAWDMTNASLADEARAKQQDACLSRMGEWKQIKAGKWTLATAEVSPATFVPMITGSGAQRIADFADEFFKHPTAANAEALRAVCAEEGLKVSAPEVAPIIEGIG